MSGGGKQESSQRQQSYTPEQRHWLTQALNIYGPQLGGGENIFGGQRVAGFNPTQNQALTQAQGFLDSFSPNQGMPLFGQTGNALQQILAGQGGAPLLSLDEANKTFNQQYVNPAYRNFQLNTAPLIQEQFAGPGFWSSARAGAVGDAASDLGSQLEAQRAGFLWDTENVNRALQEAQAGRTQQGITQGMQYGLLPAQQAAAGLAGTQSIFNFGTAEQQQRQQEINSMIQKFAEENRLTSEEDMAILMGLLGMNYSSGKGSSSGWDFGTGMKLFGKEE